MKLYVLVYILHVIDEMSLCQKLLTKHGMFVSLAC